jgi:AcrR family transcriptional regulator
MGSSSPPRVRGPYAKSAKRRREILESTLELFAEKGYAGTSLTAISEAVGVSREALRHYFSDREDLLLAVMEAADERARDRLRGTGTGELLADLAASARYNLGVPGLIALYVSLVAAAASSSNSQSRQFFRDRFANLRGDIGAAIRLGQDRGEIRGDLQADLMASLIIGASDGLSMQWLLDESTDVTGSLRLLDDIMRAPEREPNA